MNEEIKETESATAIETVSTTSITDKVKFKDSFTITKNNVVISGSCKRCGERFKGVESADGTITCPICGFTS